MGLFEADELPAFEPPLEPLLLPLEARGRDLGAEPFPDERLDAADERLDAADERLEADDERLGAAVDRCSGPSRLLLECFSVESGERLAGALGVIAEALDLLAELLAGLADALARLADLLHQPAGVEGTT